MSDSLTHFSTLFAQSDSGNGRVREMVVYELRRLADFDDPRVLWIALGSTFVVLAVVAAWWYHRESDALARPMRWLLTALRVTALAALALYFLGPEKRFDKQIETDSEVFVLVDTSQSMTVQDEESDSQPKAARIQAIRQALRNSSMLATLQENHDVILGAFDEKLQRIMRWDRTTGDSEATTGKENTTPTAPWDDQLLADGVETRLGNAIRDTLAEIRSGPLAGVIVISDGGQNTGTDPLDVADRAASLDAPIYSVGVGSTQPRRNLRVQELNAPSRVYPDDKATVTCLIQSEGFAGRSFDVELYAREAGENTGAGARLGIEKVTFAEEGEVVPLKFDFEPSEVGRLSLEVKIVASADDQYAADNQRETEVEVVESDSRVLLIASGAARDYRFLRNQLRRDRHMRVDVWLQLAQPGISQDADQLLSRFPESKEELYEYDCIVAFDPDWTLLDAQQVDILESWVAEEAGGLVVIAGPVHMAAWLQSPEHSAIRSLYPVEFQKRLTLLDDGLYGSETPWPLEFSRDGEESDFLWLGDSASESQLLWSEFEGVYGCYAVKGPKPGARVLARYSDPEAGIFADRPVYLAEQFYGAGRVMYLGSSELWRLRSLSVEYFEILYTQLIRHVSQGRLLRGSSLGSLLVPKDRYIVGDDVVVRAQLSTESREPLIAERVTARVIAPDGNGRNLVMKADEDRIGNFMGQFSVRQQGSYRIELPVPDVIDEQLVRRIQVVAPNLELDRTRRDENLLAALAKRSGGRYYTSLATAVNGSDSLPPLADAIESRAEIRTKQGDPDKDFKQWLHKLLLGVIAVALGLEWILRRLMRLA